MATTTPEEKAAAKAAKDAEKAAAKAAKDAEKAAAQATKDSATSVSVAWNGGTREFSKEVHGDDFLDLAKQFAAKFNGTIK